LHCLKDDGIVFTSTFELSTSSVNTRLEKDMPESKTALIKNSGKKTFVIDPDENKSSDFDISKMMNIVMLAIYAEYRGYSHDDMIQIVKESVPAKFVEGNIKAYLKGIEIAQAEFSKLKGNDMELPEGVILLDSLGDLQPYNTSPILVCGSHCGDDGTFARKVKNCAIKAVFLNNAGVGKNQAGIRGLAHYEAENILACAVDCHSAEIGIARDTWESGTIGHLNTLAAKGRHTNR
jgi:hypothetical protein